MTLLETITVLLLSTQPFGQIPFSVTLIDPVHAEVELLLQPPVQLVFDQNLTIVEVNHKQPTCEKDI